VQTLLRFIWLSFCESWFTGLPTLQTQNKQNFAILQAKKTLMQPRVKKSQKKAKIWSNFARPWKVIFLHLSNKCCYSDCFKASNTQSNTNSEKITNKYSKNNDT
jgi:hypothetical protein